jgi:hypothetical protein
MENTHITGALCHADRNSVGHQDNDAHGLPAEKQPRFASKHHIGNQGGGTEQHVLAQDDGANSVRQRKKRRLSASVFD